jgi:hypothetical protein
MENYMRVCGAQALHHWSNFQEKVSFVKVKITEILIEFPSFGHSKSCFGKSQEGMQVAPMFLYQHVGTRNCMEPHPFDVRQSEGGIPIMGPNAQFFVSRQDGRQVSALCDGIFSVPSSPQFNGNGIVYAASPQIFPISGHYACQINGSGAGSISERQSQNSEQTERFGKRVVMLPMGESMPFSGYSADQMLHQKRFEMTAKKKEYRSLAASRMGNTADKESHHVVCEIDPEIEAQRGIYAESPFNPYSSCCSGGLF